MIPTLQPELEVLASAITGLLRSLRLLAMTAGLLFAGFLAFPSFLGAYSDEIAVPADEVWQAANQAAQPYGVQKADAGKKEIETRWIEDQVVRSSGLLKRFASQVVRRRYRLKIRLSQGTHTTTVRIQGIFQEKSYDAPPGILWESVQPESADYEAERILFQKILRKLEADRQKKR